MEHAEPTAEDVRSARRAMLVFRILFYGGAIAAAVVLLGARASGDEPSGHVLRGETSQGIGMLMRVEEDGTATYFETDVPQRCRNGKEYTTRWYPADGAPVPFVRDREGFSVEETWTHAEVGPWQRGRAKLRAEVSRKGATGTLSVVTRWYSGDWRTVCSSGPVTFRLRPEGG